MASQRCAVDPFSFLWCSFAVFWEATASAGSAPGFFLLFGAAFVLFGLHIMVVRFFVDAWERMRTLYGVTDQRVMILSGLYRRTLHSLDLGGLTDIDIDVWRDGRGTLVFDRRFRWSANFFGGGWPGQNTTPKFEGIEDPAGVLRLIRETRRKRGAAA